jgi:hypothetical protein
MNARRRDNTPPYEIMGQKSAQPQASGRGPRPASGSPGIGGFGRSLLDAWHAGAREPLLLRVPRGMALSLLAGLLGLLILAYWVGYSRGDSAAEKRVTAIYQPQSDGMGRVPPTRSGAVTGSETANSGTYGQVSPQSTSGPHVDRRKPGLNYLILPSCPPQEALRLQVFMAERQVDVMVGLRNNKGLCQVIAMKGFTRQQYRDTDEPERYMTRMRALGRDWKTANKGGDDLSSMYYDKYSPPGL